MAEEVLMDSSSGKEFLSWFKVKEADLEIDVDKYVHITADSSYVLKAGKIGLSSSESEFFVDDLHIEPNLRPYSASSGPKKNLFELKVPRIVIQDIKPREIAINRNVNLGAVRLVEPQLIQLGKFKSDSLREKLPELSDLYQGIQPYFHNINIEGLSIEKGSFSKIAAMGDTSKQISLEGIGLYMQNMALDSNIMGKEARLMLAEELDLKIDEYKFLLKEDSYLLSGKAARISSFDKQIKGEAMSILPLAGTRKRLKRLNEDILDLEVPELQIDGVDLVELWHDRILEVDKVKISQPNVGLTNYPEIKKEKIDEISEQNLNLLIGGYLKRLLVKSLDIRGGTFDFKAGKDVLGDGFKARELEVNIRNFQLNPSASKKADRPFYADDIRVNMQVDNYSLTLPDSSYSIQAKHLGIATSDSSFYADSLVFIPLKAAKKQHGVIADIVVPRSYFHGLDVYKSYFEKELSIDSIFLSGAQINLTDLGRKAFTPRKKSFLEDIDLYPTISSAFKKLQVDRLILQKSTLELQEVKNQEKYVLPQLTLDVRNFRLDSLASHKKDLFFAEDIRLQAANFSQNLPDSLHQISVGNVDVSTQRGDIRLCSVDIQARNQGTESIGQKYRIKVPDLQLKGVDLYALLSNRIADMQIISIDTPTVELERYPEIEKDEIDSLAKANLYDLISSQLNSLRVRQLKVNQGKLQVNDYQGRTNEFKAENLNLFVSDFRLDSSSAYRTDDLFYAQHIELGATVEDYYIMLPDSSYALRIGNVGISTADSSIFAENIRLLPQWNSDKLKQAKQAWELNIPRVNMSGIDPDEWYFEKKLDFGRLHVNKPIIRQVILHLDSSGMDRDLYDILHPSFEVLNIGELEIESASFFQDRLEEDSSYQHSYKGLGVKARNFKLDSLGHFRENRLLYSDNVDIKIASHSFPFQDSMYTFTFKELRLSTENGYAEIDSALILPNFEIIDFVMRKGYAENKLFMQTHKIRLEGIDSYKLVEEGRFWGGRMEVQGLDFRVTKDQRFRMQPGRRPPFPQEMIKQLPIAIKLDRVDVMGGAVNFQMRTGFRRQPGFVYLTDIDASIQFISNDPEYLEVNPLLTSTLTARATLMKTGQLQAKFLFPLQDTLNTYSFTGNVGPWDMQELNSIMIPAGRIRIKQGKIKSTKFEVFADKYESRGNMVMRYNDLKVSVLDEKGGETDAIKRKPLLSAIANTLVVKQDNPNRRFLRYGKIRYEVNPEKGFVNHWVQAVLSGVKSSVGMEEVGEKDKKGGLKFLKKKKAIP
ncbi:MAG: hypothetical protein AAFR87_17165 [Bacteroidota bacterium]